jgi:hypothetical protein
MRRTLLTLQARLDAVRTLAYWIAMLLDESEQHPDETRRTAAGQAVAYLTPIAKAWFTELGHRSADEALQIWGGYGFVHEYGIEQTVRDSRIALIYEGTNEIQAIDLVMRKTLDDGGQRAAQLRARLAEEVRAGSNSDTTRPFAKALDHHLQRWAAAEEALIAGARDDAEWPLRVADDLLMGVSHALMAWAWARIARTAAGGAGASAAGGRTAAQWLDAARFGAQWLLPQGDVHWTRVLHRDAALPWV